MRRLQLSALRAGTTSALLLMGCQSSVAPGPLTPPPEETSLSVEIGGPSRIDTAGNVTWEGYAFGGSGAYRYQWDVTHQASQQSAATTTGQRLSFIVAANDGDYLLKLTVTSGNQARIQSLEVRNCVGGCRAAP